MKAKRRRSAISSQEKAAKVLEVACGVIAAALRRPTGESHGGTRQLFDSRRLAAAEVLDHVQLTDEDASKICAVLKS